MVLNPLPDVSVLILAHNAERTVAPMLLVRAGWQQQQQKDIYPDCDLHGGASIWPLFLCVWCVRPVLLSPLYPSPLALHSQLVELSNSSCLDL